MFNQVPFYLMNISDITSFGKRVEDSASKINNPAFLSAGLRDMLIAANKRMLDAQTKISTKEKTQRMKESDDNRDSRLMSIKYNLLSCLNRESEDLQNNAQLLINCHEKHGWAMGRFSYIKETTSVDNYIHEVETTPELSKALKVTATVPHFEELKKEQQSFKKVRDLRTEQKAGENSVTGTEVAKEIENACDMIFQYVDVMQHVKPNSQFDEFIKEVNIIISEISASVNSRLSKPETEEAV